MQSNFKLNANMDKNTINNNGHEYVDLGLPSGRLWATCNVGASAPTDYGNYYMWGSTKPNNDSLCNETCRPFMRYPHDEKRNRMYLERYQNNFYPNSILALKYDVAHITMGGDWRMPTRDEIGELNNYTTHKWVEDWQGSGVNGVILTSKKNTNSMFIPASGYRSVSDYFFQGKLFWLRSSCLPIEHRVSWGLHGCRSGVCTSFVSCGYGIAVRGVI